MSKPTTFLAVFKAALAEITDPGKVRQLQIQWERVHDAERVKELNELARAEEYYPGRFALMIGSDGCGEAWGPNEDGKYRVIIHGDKPRHVETIDQAKALMVHRYHAEEKGAGVSGAERVGQ